MGERVRAGMFSGSQPFRRFRTDAVDAGREDWRRCRRPAWSRFLDPSRHDAASSWRSSATDRWSRRDARSRLSPRALCASGCNRASCHAGRRMCRPATPTGRSPNRESSGSLARSGRIACAGAPRDAVGVVPVSRQTKIQPLSPIHLMPFSKSPEMVITTPLA